VGARLGKRLGTMQYRNSEMKIDQLIGYFNDGKINLVPPFQRGHVWGKPTRRKLMKNIVSGLPIPAIFLYKEEAGSKYSYNILDGKQRLESLLLFVGERRDDVFIKDVRKYFFHDREKRFVDYWIEIDGKKKTFQALPEDVVRDFREYAIPTIEINLTDDTSLDEIIDLFIDINQQGVEVNRFDIVKAMGNKNALLSSVFSLIAEEQKRHEDIFYKKKANEFSKVFEKVDTIHNLQSPNAKVDRIWERMLEFAVFARTKKHRTPVQILRSFIRSDDLDKTKLEMAEVRKLRECFKFLRDCYKNSGLGQTRLATDQTHFYTMVTALLDSELLFRPVTEPPPDKKALGKRIAAFAQIIDRQAGLPRDKRLQIQIKEYQELSGRRTTDVGRREQRQRLFLEIISNLPIAP